MSLYLAAAPEATVAIFLIKSLNPFTEEHSQGDLHYCAPVLQQCRAAKDLQLNSSTAV